MVGEAKMSTSNGTTRFPPRKVARDFADLVHDGLTLAELQVDLFKIDSRDALKSLVAPIVLIAVGAIVLVGSTPIVLASVALVTSEFAAIPLWGGFAIAAAAAILLGLAVAWWGWRKIKQLDETFARSRSELATNVHWMKTAVRRH